MKRRKAMNDNLEQAERVANTEPEDTDPIECVHVWNHYGTAKDGTAFFRCRRCKAETND